VMAGASNLRQHRGVAVRDEFRTFDRALARAERLIALLGRCRPLNAAAERNRVLDALRAGRLVAPQLRYAPPPPLSECRRALAAIEKHAPALGELGELYANRAAELDLEAQLVEATGQPQFRALAARRYPSPRCSDTRWADATAAEWIRCVPGDARALVRANDASDERSLRRRLEHEIGRLRLPVRIVEADLDASAATGDGVIYIDRRQRHSPAAASRIAVHEVMAHALPRWRARSESLGLFVVGTRGSSEDEEGRAIRIEREAGLLDAARRRVLGLRHVSAASAIAGASWVDTMRLLLDVGTSRAESVDLTARVHRGGGLAREIVYLPALRRVDRSFEAEPDLEGWLERGRLGLTAAVVIRRAFGGSPFLTPHRGPRIADQTEEVLPFG
jgi:hypothetical protein